LIGRPAALLYAAVRSDCACCAAAVVCSVVAPAPVTSPGGNPVMSVPGHSPRLSWSVVGPVLVTVEPASTE